MPITSSCWLNLKARRTRLRAVFVWACLCGAPALVGCQLGPGREVTSKTPYAGVIGARYSVAVDDLFAYGVFEIAEQQNAQLC
jgi:hypothetical protein